MGRNWLGPQRCDYQRPVPDLAECSGGEGGDDSKAAVSMGRRMRHAGSHTCSTQARVISYDVRLRI